MPRYEGIKKEIGYWVLRHFLEHNNVCKADVCKEYIRQRLPHSQFKNLYPSMNRVFKNLENVGLIKEERREESGRIPYRLTVSGFIAALGALYLLDRSFPAVTENLVQGATNLLKANSTYFPLISKKWDSLIAEDKEIPTHVLFHVSLVYLLQIRQKDRIEVKLYRRIRKKPTTSGLTPWWRPKKRKMIEEQFMNEVTLCFFQGLDIITKHPILEPEEYDRWLEIQSRDKELVEILLERLEHEKHEILDYYDELEARLQGKIKPWIKT